MSKVWKHNLAVLASEAMLGLHPDVVGDDPYALPYVGVKCSQFSFSRLGQADPVSGVDMASTGEVACLGRTPDEALLKSMLSVGYAVPSRAVLISSGNALQKADLLDSCRLLASRGITIFATDGTCKYLSDNGVPAFRALWPRESGESCPAALDLIREHKVDLVVNVPKDFSNHQLGDGYKVRRAAVDFNVPLLTDARLAAAFIKASCTLSGEDVQLLSWQEY